MPFQPYLENREDSTGQSRTFLVVEGLHVSSAAASDTDGGGGPTLLGSGAVGTPSLAFAADSDSGLYRAAANDLRLVVAGADALSLIATAVVVPSGLNLSWGSSGVATIDLSLSRGAANRLDLATGDSFNLVNGDIIVNNLAVGVTTNAGLTLQNTTAAASGAQQYSPGFSLIGQGWKTNATAASQATEARLELRPVEGAAAPTFNVVLMGRVDSGAWSDILTMSSAGTLTVAATLNVNSGNVNLSNTAQFGTLTRGGMSWPGNGLLSLFNTAETVGIRFQYAAAPTIASGFGTSPAISTGSTDTAGEVDVGTGGTASSGVINFATTWARAPFVVVTNSTTGAVVRATATTTALTITAPAAFAASDKINWICVGASV